MIFRLISFLAIGLFLLSCKMQIQKNDFENYPTGLKPMTKEEFEIIKQTWPQVRKVKMNSLAIKRINEERRKLNLQEINVSSAPIGTETISSIGESDDYNFENSVGIMTENLLPRSVDNSKLDHFPPVGNQESLRSCVSWASTYYQYTHMYNLLHGKNAKGGDKRNIFSPKWTYNFVNNGENRGSHVAPAYEVLKNLGAATWSEFPYDGVNYQDWPQDNKVWESALYRRADKTETIIIDKDNPINGLNEIKMLLANGYVLIFGSYVQSWRKTIIKDNIYSSLDNSFIGKNAVSYVNGNKGGHAMTIVGYNDDIWVDINKSNTIDRGELGALRVVNSWGNEWEDNGFIWLSYDALGKISNVRGSQQHDSRIPAIHWNVIYSITPKKNYSPQLIGEITVENATRDNLSITQGAWDFSKGPVDEKYNCPIWIDGVNEESRRACFLGDSFFWNQPSIPINQIFVVDFSDLLPMATIDTQFYFSIISDSKRAFPYIRDAKLIDLSNGNASNMKTDNTLERLDYEDNRRLDIWFDAIPSNYNLTCEGGFYLSGDNCIGVGRGYYSPNGDIDRHRCTNKPSNATQVTYANTNSISNNCPIERVDACNVGYVPAGNLCEQEQPSICNPQTQPYPHWNVKDGICLPSCGVLGGTQAQGFTSGTCSQRNMTDAGNSYDALVCCKPNEIITSCQGGYYLSGNNCIGVGRGYYSPNGDINRYSCTNKPPNATQVTYANANTSTNDCPIEKVNLCQSGYNPEGLACVREELKTKNNNLICSSTSSTKSAIIGYYNEYCFRCPDEGGLNHWFEEVTIRRSSLANVRTQIDNICTKDIGLPQMSKCNRQSKNAEFGQCPTGWPYLPNNTDYCFKSCQEAFSSKPVSCSAGYYLSKDKCVGVGTGFYSSSGSTERYSCTNKPSNATNVTYSYANSGSNSCPISKVNTCQSGYEPFGQTCVIKAITSCSGGYYLSGGKCVGVGTGFYSSSGSTKRYSCTNKPSYATSVTYSYANSSSNNCPISKVNTCQSGYEPSGKTCVIKAITSCSGGYYLSGSSCRPVGTGYYSPNGSTARISCTNKPSYATSVSYASANSSSNNCPISKVNSCVSGYMPSGKVCIKPIPTSCSGGYYLSGGRCIGVGTGFYSSSGSTKRYSCTNKPSYATSVTYSYANSSSNNCPISKVNTCQSGYEPSGKTCTKKVITYVLTSNSPNVTIYTGTQAKVYGTSGTNIIRVRNQAYAELINFPGFNMVYFYQKVNLFKVSRSGTVVSFIGSDGTTLKIPATSTKQKIIFSDKQLYLSITGGKVMLNNQIITTSKAYIK